MINRGDRNKAQGLVGFRPFMQARADFERTEIERALKAAHGNKAEAARLLRLNRTTLLEIMRRLRMPINKPQAKRPRA